MLLMMMLLLITLSNRANQVLWDRIIILEWDLGKDLYVGEEDWGRGERRERIGGVVVKDHHHHHHCHCHHPHGLNPQPTADNPPLSPSPRPWIVPPHYSPLARGPTIPKSSNPSPIVLHRWDISGVKGVFFFFFSSIIITTILTILILFITHHPPPPSTPNIVTTTLTTNPNFQTIPPLQQQTNQQSIIHNHHSATTPQPPHNHPQLPIHNNNNKETTHIQTQCHPLPSPPASCTTSSGSASHIKKLNKCALNLVLNWTRSRSIHPPTVPLITIPLMQSSKWTLLRTVMIYYAWKV